ncbi:GSCOCT00006986001.2-RA-CDS [Cotesia congregata]|uniref:Odorant receptor n=1 Tax=Cotesia congregata TaxID=51543 RepID=A0A8J2MKN5_COTCN|nr:GSCOCT00006986001.2-RA-CDS [Cotesia congregata]CAG5092694.1 olfactory receptor 170 [Cotesia congregata]
MGIELPQSFQVLTYAGIWRPLEWKGLKARAYDLYTSIVIFFHLSFLTSGLLDMEFENFEFIAMVDHVSLVVGYVQNIPKITSILNYRQDIIEVIDKLQIHPLRLKNADEELTHAKYDRLDRMITFWFPKLGMTSIAWYTMRHFVAINTAYGLPYRGYFPYNYTVNPVIYWCTAVEQMYSVIILAVVNAGFNVFLPTMMFQVCGKLTVLQHRFKLLIKKLEIIASTDKQILSEDKLKKIEQQLLCDWVENHIAILNLFKFTNILFSKAVFIHYVTNTVVLCTVAYMLSQTQIDDLNFVTNVFFFIVMCSQQFLQCITAQQVTIEFENLRNEIYNSDWHSSRTTIMKSMLIIMCKTSQPVVFITGHFVDLSLDSFKKIIKLSYTIFNVLE